MDTNLNFVESERLVQLFNRPKNVVHWYSNGPCYYTVPNIAIRVKKYTALEIQVETGSIWRSKVSNAIKNTSLFPILRIGQNVSLYNIMDENFARGTLLLLKCFSIHVKMCF